MDERNYKWRLELKSVDVGEYEKFNFFIKDNFKRKNKCKWVCKYLQFHRWVLYRASIGGVTAVLFKLIDKYFWNIAEKVGNTFFWGLGISIIFLLVFRANKSHSRFWEGRGHIGDVSRASFELCRQIVCFTSNGDEETQDVAQKMVIWAQDFYWLMVLRLHSADLKLDGVMQLNEKEMNQLQDYTQSNYRHKPLVVIAWISSAICWLKRKDALTSLEALSIDDSLQEMVTGYFGAIKIKTTAIPIAYEKLILTMAAIWSWTIPITFVDAFEWSAPIFAILLGIMIFSIDGIATELSHPFGSGFNDLPLLNIGNALKDNKEMVVEQAMAGIPQMDVEILHRASSPTFAQ